MDRKKRYEKLNALPAYGPTYVSVTGTEEKYSSEGFVVRFIRSDNTDWVANFKPGWTHCNAIFDFPGSENVIVVAGGQCYVMNPDFEKPLEVFAVTIDNAIQIDDSRIILTDGLHVRLIESGGNLWCSPRISFDGIKDLKLNDKFLTGLAYNPMHNQHDWMPFTFDIQTRRLIKGSYIAHIPDNAKTKWWKLW